MTRQPIPPILYLFPDGTPAVRNGNQETVRLLPPKPKKPRTVTIQILGDVR